LFSQVNKPVVSIDGYEKVPENDEDALLKAAANQPISVAIDAGGSDFQFYSEVNFRKLLKCLLISIPSKHSHCAKMINWHVHLCSRKND
jgi:hypothetical protein